MLHATLRILRQTLDAPILPHLVPKWWQMGFYRYLSLNSKPSLILFPSGAAGIFSLFIPKNLIQLNSRTSEIFFQLSPLGETCCDRLDQPSNNSSSFPHEVFLKRCLPTRCFQLSTNARNNYSTVNIHYWDLNPQPRIKRRRSQLRRHHWNSAINHY